MKVVGIILFIFIAALAALSVWQRGLIQESGMTVESNQSTSSAARTENQSSPRGPVAPAIVSDTWFNSPELAPADLRGKVVVVEFWTFG